MFGRVSSLRLGFSPCRGPGPPEGGCLGLPWASGSFPRSPDPTRALLSSRLEYRLFADVCILNHSLRVGPLNMPRAAVPCRRLPRSGRMSSIILNCPTQLCGCPCESPTLVGYFWLLGRRGCDRWCPRNSTGHIGDSRTTEGPPCLCFQAGASAAPIVRVRATWLGFGSDFRS